MLSGEQMVVSLPNEGGVTPGLMVTFTVSLPVQPFASVTTTKYVPLPTAMVCVLDPSDQEYEAPAFCASSVTLPPHWVMSAPRLTVGGVLMIPPLPSLSDP